MSDFVKVDLNALRNSFVLNIPQPDQAVETEQLPDETEGPVETLIAPSLAAPSAPVVAPAEQPVATFFESIALPLLARGFKVAPCYPREKRIHTKLVPNPLSQISNDPAQIHAWGVAEPNANVCVYAEQVPGGLCFLDKDGAISLVEKYKQETGRDFPRTLLVCSSIIDDGNGGTITKGHWYFGQTSRTAAMSNIPEHKTGGLFSFRVNNEYVTSIGSIHPKTGLPYQVYDDAPIIYMPDDLVDWLLAQVVADKPKLAATEGAVEKLKHGTLHPAIVAAAGRIINLLGSGGSYEELEEQLLTWTHRHCEAPIDESRVVKVAKSAWEKFERAAPGFELTMAKPVAQPAQSNQNQQGPTGVSKPHERYAMTPEQVDAEMEKEHPVLLLPDDETGPHWDDSIMYGIAGEIVREASKYCESHPAGMYVDLLVSLGNIIGRGPYFNVNKTRHYTNEFMARVGDTSRSRKGTGRDVVDELLSQVDPVWHKTRIASGFGSAEAIVDQIRDNYTSNILDKKSGGFKSITVPGVPDKRLNIREGELASVFQLASKKESRADVVLRDGWDGKTLRNLVKGRNSQGLSNSNVCEEPMISISGDSTREELGTKLPPGAVTNGFGNRFLYVFVRRLKECPNGSPDVDWTPFLDRLRAVIQEARQVRYVPVTKYAHKVWNIMYGQLEDPANRPPGIGGSMTDRGSAHVRRIALILALLDGPDVDGSVEVNADHLRAARDLWEYCQDSAAYIFNGAIGDQQRIEHFIWRSGPVTVSDIREMLFKRNRRVAWIQTQLDALVQARANVEYGVKRDGEKYVCRIYRE
jgi:hypothetical protein